MARTVEKGNFLLKCSFRDRIKWLTLEQRGQVLTSVFDYANGGNVDVNGFEPVVAIVLEEIFEFMDWNREKYNKISQSRSEAGKAGAAVTNEKRWGSQQISENGQQMSHDVKVDIEDDVVVGDDVKDGVAVKSEDKGEGGGEAAGVLEVKGKGVWGEPNQKPTSTKGMRMGLLINTGEIYYFPEAEVSEIKERRPDIDLSQSIHELNNKLNQLPASMRPKKQNAVRYAIDHLK